MSEDEFNEFSYSLLKIAEGAVATSDLLAMLCIHFAASSPTQALSFASTIQGILESETIEKTEIFEAIAGRIVKALTGDQDLPFLSLKKSAPAPTNPEELRAHLRVILGGLS